MRVLFMGTPAFALPSLKILSEIADVVGVCTQPDRPQGRGMKVHPSSVKAEALKLQLEVQTPERLSDPGVLEWAQGLKPDVLCVVAYGKILRQAWLDLPPLGAFNLHGSLLPRWRGAAPVARAIQAGDQESGACIMQLVPKMDAGDVYSEVRVPVATHTSASLMELLALRGAELWVPFFERLRSKEPLVGVPQDLSLVTYAKKLQKEESLLRLDCSALELERQVRAFEPWPKSFICLEKRKLFIRAARVSEAMVPSGSLLVSRSSVLIGTQKGALECKALQWEGGKVLDAATFALHHQGAWPIDTI